jgi:hypothetical protein
VTGVRDYLKRGVALTFLMLGEVTKPHLGRTASTAEGSKFEAGFILCCRLG